MDTLRFSRKSWHFWLYSRGLLFRRGHYRSGAKNLCAYFWTIVGIIVGNLVLIASAVFFPVFLGVQAWLHPFAALAIALIFLFIGVFLAVVWLVGSWLDNRKLRLQGAERKPNLLVEYVKAKKAKYCPLIEWQD